jgi:hypothetical protein
MLRKAWGCDAPATAPVFVTACPQCLGWDPACSTCGGRGEVRHWRCPPSQTGPEARFVVDVYDALEAGVLPFDGLGWAELPDALVRALRVVGLERARIAAEEARRREAQQRAEAAARSGRSSSGR